MSSTKLANKVFNIRPGVKHDASLYVVKLITGQGGGEGGGGKCGHSGYKCLLSHFTYITSTDYSFLIPCFAASHLAKRKIETVKASNLHPSWEASKRRKQQETGIAEFKGQRIVFSET